jgi:hypothetical protein
MLINLIEPVNNKTYTSIDLNIGYDTEAVEK